jgi:TfoX/Sxy family transcriptional regulator of competence genes
VGRFTFVATDPKFVEAVREAMVPLDVSARPMFGEYGLYHQGKNFALVCNNTLFIKVTDPGRSAAGRITLAPPYPGAKPAYKISSTRMKDREWLLALVRVTSTALPTSKPKKTRPT